SVIPVAATRVWVGDHQPQAFPTDAVAHVAIAGVLGLLFALTYATATDTAATLVLAAIAAFGVGALVRRYVPRPSLALLGPFLALVAAWLIPQRADIGSAIILAALFGVGAALAAPAVRRPRPLVLAAAFLVLVLVRLESTRAATLGVAVIGVTIAAFTAVFGRIGIPRTRRLRT